MVNSFSTVDFASTTSVTRGRVVSSFSTVNFASTANNGAADPATVASSQGSPAVAGSNPVSSDPTKSTLGAGGPIITLSGTIYSPEPSDGGVVTQNPGGSITIAATSYRNLPSSPSGYALAGQTLQAGSAATISGTTYSVLPLGSGVVVGANGYSSTVTASGDHPVTVGTGIVATPIPMSSLLQSGYIVDGQTVSAGSVITVSGTTYSVLPSGSGVIQGANGYTTTIGDSYTLQSGYVLDGQTISAGSAITVSGTTYSVLPSGGGIVQGANGQTTTIDPAGDNPVTLAPGIIATPVASPSQGSVATVNGLTITRVPNGVVIGGSTMTAGSPPETINGSVYSINSDGQLVVGSSITVGQQGGLAALIGAVQSAASGYVTSYSSDMQATIVVSGQTYTAAETAGPDQAAIDGTTLKVGGSALVLGGETLGLGSHGIVIAGDGSTRVASFSRASATERLTSSRATSSAAGTSVDNPTSSIASAATQSGGLRATIGSGLLCGSFVAVLVVTLLLG